MIDHVGFAVSDATRSRAYYEQALAPLGITLIMSVTPEQTESGGSAHGFGADGKPFFWIGDNGDQVQMAPGHLQPFRGNGDLITVGEGIHVALTAATRAEVDAFYLAALAAGGRDNGPPGIRAHYHPNYYGAFVRDPDGNNIEAVCHRPE